MIGPTDLLHPSPTPHFKTFQVFLIYCPKRPSRISVMCFNSVARLQKCEAGGENTRKYRRASISQAESSPETSVHCHPFEEFVNLRQGVVENVCECGVDPSGSVRCTECFWCSGKRLLFSQLFWRLWFAVVTNTHNCTHTATEIRISADFPLLPDLNRLR
jgi:hypothetical protein